MGSRWMVPHPAALIRRSMPWIAALDGLMSVGISRSLRRCVVAPESRIQLVVDLAGLRARSSAAMELTSVKL